MKSNSFLKFIIPAIILGVVFVFVIFWPSKRESANEDAQFATISAKDARLLGVEGDTAEDKLATLVGQMRGLRQEIDTVKKQNEVLVRENDRLRGREANVDARVDQAVRKATSEIEKFREERESRRPTEQSRTEQSREQARGVWDNLTGQINQFGRTAPTPSETEEEDLLVGLGLQPGDSRAFKTPFDALANFGNRRQGTGSTAAPTVPAAESRQDSFVWIEPSDGIALDPRTQKPQTGNFVALLKPEWMSLYYFLYKRS